MSRANQSLDRELVNVKMPKWLKQLAAQIGEMSGEDIGEVFERISGDAIRREYRKRADALHVTLGEAGA